MTAPALPSREELLRLHERTRRDPLWFARNVIGVDPYEKQIEIIEAVRDAELAAEADEGTTQVSINGANGVGKDWTIGEILVPWWMAAHAAPCPRCRSVETGKKWAPQCKVIITGPTFRQVTEIVWRETRFAYNNSRTPLGGRMLPGEQAIVTWTPEASALSRVLEEAAV